MVLVSGCRAVCLRDTWPMTAGLPLPAVVDNFDRLTALRARFQELAQVWAIDLSLLMDCISGTAYLSTYAILNLPLTELPPVAEVASVC